jgi:hypothetical protein
MDKLPVFRTSWRPGERHLPVRVKLDDRRFTAGVMVTLVGTRWSRSWGLLKVGTVLDWNGQPDELGGGSWRTKFSAPPGGPYTHHPKRTITRPTLALCKWRYR